MAVRRTLNYFIIIHACNDTRTKAWKGIKVSAVPHNLWAMINAMWILILIAIFKGVNLIGGLVVASGCHVMGRSGRAVGLLAFFFSLWLIDFCHWQWNDGKWNINWTIRSYRFSSFRRNHRLPGLASTQHNILWSICATKIFLTMWKSTCLWPEWVYEKKKSQMIRRESIANSVEIKRHKMDSCAANIALNLQYIHLRYTTLWRYFRFDQNELRVSVWSAFRRISLN